MHTLELSSSLSRKECSDRWRGASIIPRSFTGYFNKVNSEEYAPTLWINRGAVHIADLIVAEKSTMLAEFSRRQHSLAEFTRIRHDPESLVVLQYPVKNTHREASSFTIETEFSPSFELCKLVREVSSSESTQEATDIIFADIVLMQAKSKHLKTALYAMFQTIANSEQLQESSKQIVLSNGSRFHEAIAKAMLFRINVSFYDYLNFLSRLHTELLNSIRFNKIASNNWKLILNDEGEIALEVSASIMKQQRPFRERAKSYKPRMAYSANK